MPRSRSIRSSLMRGYALVILVVAGLMLTVTFAGARTAAREQSTRLLRRAMQQTTDRLGVFFHPVATEVLLARDWIGAGVLVPSDEQSARLLLEPSARRLPHVAAVTLADDSGAWLRVERAHGPPGPASGSWRVTSSLVEDLSRHDWFTEAMAAPVPQVVQWSRPRVLDGLGTLALTASARYETPSKRKGVVAVDVTLQEISRFTMGLSVTEDAKVVVLMLDPNRIIGLPRDERFATEADRREALRRPAGTLDTPVVNDARRAAIAEVGGEGDLSRPLRFESGGRAWWLDTDVYPLEAGERVLFVAILIPEDDLLGTRRALRWWILGSAGVALLLALGLSLGLSRRAGQPIQALVAGTERLRQGDFSAGEPIESGIEEVQRQADAQDEMRLALESLVRMEYDLKVARRIQQATLPSRVPELAGYRMAGSSVPADDTGGDTYDLIGVRHRPDGPGWEICTNGGAEQVVLLLADATGHGVGPALSVAQLRAMVRMAVRAMETPEGLAHHLNEQLHADLPVGRFITAWLGRLDADSGVLTWLSAGHGPILHYHAETGTIEELGSQMPPFGLFPAPEIEPARSVVLEPGDVIVVLSDGFHESLDTDGQEFGEKRVRELVRARAGDAPESILASLTEAVTRFTGGAPAKDDRTAVILKRES